MKALYSRLDEIEILEQHLNAANRYLRKDRDDLTLKIMDNEIKLYKLQEERNAIKDYIKEHSKERFNVTDEYLFDCLVKDGFIKGTKF